MKSLFLVLLLLAVPASAGSVSPVSHSSASPWEKIQDYCESDWAPNYQMVVSCMNQQADAINELLPVVAALSSPREQAIMGKCADDWWLTSRPNAQMTLFCYKQNREALRQLGR